MEKYWRAGQATDDNMTHAHCMLGTQDYKHTHTEYVIFIAFPLRQWFHESATLLHYTYVARVVMYNSDESQSCCVIIASSLARCTLVTSSTK